MADDDFDVDKGERKFCCVRYQSVDKELFEEIQSKMKSLSTKSAKDIAATASNALVALVEAYTFLTAQEIYFDKMFTEDFRRFSDEEKEGFAKYVHARISVVLNIMREMYEGLAHLELVPQEDVVKTQKH